MARRARCVSEHVERRVVVLKVRLETMPRILQESEFHLSHVARSNRMHFTITNQYIISNLISTYSPPPVLFQFDR